jgi:hypothetical protein
MMSDIDEYVESKLRDREFFEAVMPKAISFFRTVEVNKLRLYNLMHMRLGHTTGKKMLYKDIAKVTLNLRTNKAVSTGYCAMLYKRGLRLARRAIYALGKSDVD